MNSVLKQRYRHFFQDFLQNFEPCHSGRIRIQNRKTYDFNADGLPHDGIHEDGSMNIGKEKFS